MFFKKYCCVCIQCLQKIKLSKLFESHQFFCFVKNTHLHEKCVQSFSMRKYQCLYRKRINQNFFLILFTFQKNRCTKQCFCHNYLTFGSQEQAACFVLAVLNYFVIKCFGNDCLESLSLPFLYARNNFVMPKSVAMHMESSKSSAPHSMHSLAISVCPFAAVQTVELPKLSAPHSLHSLTISIYPCSAA